ncbi:hypothetical protein N8Z70_00860 [Candidatus Puniceispirillum sp.]|nr:hypothetical protein [bacterium]MDC1293578.1 hypothetical protein [Candidatus Puniceispirillum sp.]
MKQRPFMPLIGGHGKPDIGLGVVGCIKLALVFLRLQTGHMLHLCFGVVVGMKPASASKHKQDEVKRQNQHHFMVVLELAEDWNQKTHMKHPPQRASKATASQTGR